MPALAPLARASRTNFHPGMGRPASMIWRVAPRSVLPGRIENSTVGAARSIGESANQSIQPQNPSAAAETDKSNSFSRNNIESVRNVGLDYARIITVKPGGEEAAGLTPRVGADKPLNSRQNTESEKELPVANYGNRRSDGSRSRRRTIGKRPCPARPPGRPPVQRGRRGNLLARAAELRRGGGGPALEQLRRLLLAQGQDAREFPAVARRGGLPHGLVAGHRPFHS